MPMRIEERMRVHTQAAHQLLKRNQLLWRQLEYVGVQVFHADEDGPEERLELRNCTCGSTLARRIEVR